jgi:S-adenosylmethionine hydrolase
MMARICLLLALATLVGSGCQTARPLLVFMSDFGTTDEAVAVCKGVMLSTTPTLEIIDLTHEVPAFSIADGARFLSRAAAAYPRGTVFVGVIDPGVGSERRAIVARSGRGQYFVVPDNGLLTLVEARDGIEGAREITTPGWMRGAGVSSTFHGRDLFSPAGARLAGGADWRTAGPPVRELVRLELPVARLTGSGVTGEVIALDGPYGNLITNLEGGVLAELGYDLGDLVPVTIGDHRLKLPLVRTFSDVPEGEPLLYVNSRDTVGLAVNLGSFADTYGITPPAPIGIPRGRRP